MLPEGRWWPRIFTRMIDLNTVVRLWEGGGGGRGGGGSGGGGGGGVGF